MQCEQVGPYLVMSIKYPNCSNCAFEGTKTMIFMATLMDALRWKKIDPHFRAKVSVRSPREAPSPVARFPGNTSGFADALEWSNWKEQSRKK